MIFRSFVFYFQIVLLLSPVLVIAQEGETVSKTSDEPVNVTSDSMKISQKTGWMDYAAVNRITDRFYNRGYDFYYIRIWQLLVLQMFLEKNE